MRFTVTVDDELFTEAQKYLGLSSKSAVLNEALKVLIRREVAQRLARLGGSEPDLKAAPRRRMPPETAPMEIKILDPRLCSWGFPHWGSALSAGLDLHACIEVPLRLVPSAPPVLIPAGFAMRIGEGFCGLIAPRSGAGHRGLVLGNTVGVIDADYEGPVMLSCWNRNAGPGAAEIVVEPGERIAQMLFVPIVRPAVSFVEDFGEASQRGVGGFGSTGRGGATSP